MVSQRFAEKLLLKQYDLLDKCPFWRQINNVKALKAKRIAIQLEILHLRSHWSLIDSNICSQLWLWFGWKSFGWLLLISNFQFRSVFQPRSVIPAFAELLFASCDLELWLMTFNSELDPIMPNIYIKGHIYCPNRQTTQPIVPYGPLQWSVKNRKKWQLFVVSVFLLQVRH